MSSTPTISQQIAWDPSSFVGFSDAQLELIRTGFMAALGRVYERETAPPPPPEPRAPIELGKRYRTRSGDPVRLLCVDGPSTHYPVIGLVGHELKTWTGDGRYCSALEIATQDLVEAPE